MRKLRQREVSQSLKTRLPENDKEIMTGAKARLSAGRVQMVISVLWYQGLSVPDAVKAQVTLSRAKP